MNVIKKIKDFLFKEKVKVNYHFVLVEAPLEAVAPQIVLWGEAPWWPPQSKMRFTRLTSGEIAEGTEYAQKVLLPWGPQWMVRVTKLVPHYEIERTFFTGMFTGKESLRIEERYNGIKVNYYMTYQILKFKDWLIWKIVFQRLHDQNIDLILKAMKKYVEQKNALKEKS